MSQVKVTADSGGGTVSLKAPATTTSNAAVVLTLPVDDGAANTWLKSNGSGVTSWAAPTATEIATSSGTASASTFLCGNNTWAAPGGGKILQVKSTTKKDTMSHSGTTHTLITGLTVSITPSATSSKILILYDVSLGFASATYVEFRIARGTDDTINIGDARGSNTRCTHYRYADNYYSTTDYAHLDIYPFVGNYLDSPSTTSATTYGIYIATTVGGNSMIVNSSWDSSSAYYGTSTSTITAMEVGA